MSQHSGPLGPYHSESRLSHPASDTASHSHPTQQPSNAPGGVWGYRDPALESTDSIDSLADLFLGELSPTLGLVLPPHNDDSSSLQAPHSRPRAAPPASFTPSAPPMPVQDVAPAGDGRMPQPRPQIRVRPAAHMRGCLDPTGSVSPEVEALLVGNLPVLASAWVQQYAKHRASTLDGIVALVRSIDEQVSVDLIYPAGTVAPADHAEEPGTMTSLEEALRRAVAVAARVVIRADRVREEDLAACEADRVTLLTACDDAAIVQCYRSLKLLATARGEHARPDLRVAVLAATPQRSGEIAQRLSSACSAFLSSRIDVEHCGQRMSASHSLRLFAGKSPATPDVQMLVRSVRNALPGPTQPRQSGSVGDSSPQSAGDPKVVVRPFNPPPANHAKPTQQPPTLRLAANHVAPKLPPELIDSDRRGLDLAAVAPQPTREPLGTPTAWSRSEPRCVVSPASRSTPTSSLAASRVSTTSLAVRMGKFELLPIRCPQASHIELTLAPDGSLHLLAAEGSFAGDTASMPGLLTARAWVLANHALLTLAVPALRLDVAASTPVTMHVLTDRPKALRTLLETDVRVHVLAPMSAGAPADLDGVDSPEPAWLCLELN